MSPVSKEIWAMKYRLKNADGTHVDAKIEDSWRRVAAAIAKVEQESKRKKWEQRFFDALADFAFLPAGRILANAGAERTATLFNCFVMNLIEDDMASIFENVKEAALTMQQGGGIGHDFSTLRPKGAPVKGVGADASGPVSFMNIWDAMCQTIMSAGARRGAMMGTLACDHPDIEDFVAAKSDPNRLRMFNLSVLVTDAFIEAVDKDADWPLVFSGTTYKTVRARDLWEKIMRAAYDYAEPGVIFIDRINAENNLAYAETIRTTNPCGEQPLPPYGACVLGSINLAKLIQHPFTARAALDDSRLQELTRVAVRFLDNVIDASRYPLKAQRQEAQSKRRIGLGITGLADALVMCGLHYGSKGAVRQAEKWMSFISQHAYLASAKLAREKGAFPLFEVEKILARPGLQRMGEDVRDAIRADGLRNGLLTSIAPTGTISLFAGNVSSGIEPIFDLAYERRMLLADGQTKQDEVEDYAYRLFKDKFGNDAELPEEFVTAFKLTPDAHLDMQAALQRHTDSSISKTINCPENISFDAFNDIYRSAYEKGLKGCTAYRPNPVTGAVLSSSKTPANVETQEEPSPSISDALPMVKAERTGDVVYLAHPLERDEVLSGRTHKLKWPESDHAIYVTINDIIQDSRRRPFEIFINSKNLEHYAWTVALTRMIALFSDAVAMFHSSLRS
ncbi:vitamin B12-dependent ribonucleoside-diphosphate reductase [bacterium MnTg02]|nr:vitamin B12-dependent ribonucleoside-diphosphate reductase [bacterium MnTg02]